MNRLSTPLRAAVTVGMVAVAGCATVVRTPFTAAQLEVRVTPDTVVATRTDVGIQFELHLLVRNVGTTTVFSIGCPTGVLERRVGDTWVVIRSQVCTMGGGNTYVPLRPGESHEFRQRFSGDRSGLGWFTDAASVGGTYRIVFPATYTATPRTDNDAVPKELSASNSFVVRMDSQ